jgi:K+-transporting ATPase KdpA subunit
MTANGVLQLGLALGVLLACVRPLGWYMARVYSGRVPVLDRLLGPVERAVYRLARIDPTTEMTWQRYAGAVLTFGFVSVLAVYGVQRLQAVLPLNPEGQPAVSPDSSFNTAVSFATNTNWQGYGGESTMSYLTQMTALAVQNFLSAAAGMAVLVALIRGFARRSVDTIGNFWVDLVRGTVYVLLPLSLLLAVALVSQGVPQTVSAYHEVPLVEPTADADGKPVTTQRIAVGPVASQVAIKHLGTNGGGFFNANSAHPLENPTPLSNLLQMVAILLIPAALCWTFGEIVGDRRQGWAILAAMLVIFLPLLGVAVWAEHQPNPALAKLGVDQTPSDLQPGGNMEGKEARFGITNSAFFAVVTTAASCGAVNSMHDSYTTMPVHGRSSFENIYAGQPRWEIGRPQKAILAVADRITGSVLDAGCGTGENALYFASRGQKVTGIDFLAEPISRAKQKAVERGLTATFLVMDALALKELPEVFDSAIDSGLFHVFSDDDRRRYVEGLASVLKPGGRLFLLCFSDAEPGEQGPRRVSRKEIEDAFAEGWVVESIEPSRFEVRPDPDDISFTDGGPKAWFVVVRRAG